MFGFSTQKSKNKAKSSQLAEIAKVFADKKGFDETEEYVGDDGSCIPVPYDTDEPIEATQNSSVPTIVSWPTSGIHVSNISSAMAVTNLTLPTGQIPSSWSTSAKAAVWGTQAIPYMPLTSAYADDVDQKIRDPNVVEYDICVIKDTKWPNTDASDTTLHEGYVNMEIIRK